MLRALLLDFNGVLVDDEPLHFELFRRVLAEEGLDLSERDYYERYLGFDDRGAFLAKLADAGRTADPPQLARLIARKAAYYQELVHRQGYPFFPGARELVRAAAEAGLRLGVVSGALREEVAGALVQAGLAERVPILVTAEDVAESKPHPEGYLLALELLNSVPPLPERLIHPHEVLAIEDSPAGLESAAAAGLRTLGVAHTYSGGRLDADATVDTLEGLTVEAIERLL